MISIEFQVIFLFDQFSEFNYPITLTQILIDNGIYMGASCFVGHGGEVLET